MHLLVLLFFQLGQHSKFPVEMKLYASESGRLLKSPQNSIPTELIHWNNL